MKIVKIKNMAYAISGGVAKEMSSPYPRVRRLVYRQDPATGHRQFQYDGKNIDDLTAVQLLATEGLQWGGVIATYNQFKDVDGKGVIRY